MKYNQQPVVTGITRFSKAPVSEIEFSRMRSAPTHITTFNAGDIVPIYCAEVLPHDTFAIDLDTVVRQTTLLVPTMGEMVLDVYAYFVPNRVVNESWKNVQGENSSGQWVAPEVELAPLWNINNTIDGVKVPVGSVADYYGFPTQQRIPGSILAQCNDLKFRGYLEIYNEYFRDQNYQPPIPYSKLNVYNGFFEYQSTRIALDGNSPSGQQYVSTSVDSGELATGGYGAGAIQQALYGNGINAKGIQVNGTYSVSGRTTSFSALAKPLKANKFHDYFTSVLPSSQKGPQIVFGLGKTAPVTFDTSSTTFNTFNKPLRFKTGITTGNASPSSGFSLYINNTSQGTGRVLVNSSENTFSSTAGTINGWNISGEVDLSNATGITVNELRTASAIQQVYETLARGGSRYRETISSFFGLEVDNPFSDIPVRLGHIRRKLDLFQTAQTSASVEGGTPQSTLTAFGYTNTNGSMFTKTFVEHGYIHILAVVRHKNLYSTYLARDNFRLSALDFYTPPLANISEQPIFSRELNPFYDSNNEKVIGFQEGWAEYRYEPDRVSGYMRIGLGSESLSAWNYADNFDPNFTMVDGKWLVSNSEEILNRSLAYTSDIVPQFKAIFTFNITKERPMPTYSVPGLDQL